MKDTSIDVQEFEALYYAGMSPADLAKKFGKTTQRMAHWMYARGYPRFCPAHEKIIHDMYYSGASDIEIAHQVNSTSSAIAIWRHRHRLYKHTRPRRCSKINPNEFEAIYNSGYSPRRIAEHLGVCVDNVRSYMQYHEYDRFCPEYQKIIRDMHTSGESAETISKQVNAKPFEVRRWVEKNLIVEVCI